MKKIIKSTLVFCLLLPLFAISEGSTELIGEWQFSHFSCEDGKELSEAGKTREKKAKSLKMILSITNNTMMYVEPQSNSNCLSGLLAKYSLLDENTFHKKFIITLVSCNGDSAKIEEEIIGTARIRDFKIQGDKLSIYEPLEYDTSEEEATFLNCGSDVRVVENFTRITSSN